MLLQTFAAAASSFSRLDIKRSHRWGYLKLEAVSVRVILPHASVSSETIACTSHATRAFAKLENPNWTHQCWG